MTLRLVMNPASGATGETKMRLVMNEAARRLATRGRPRPRRAAFRIEVILDGSKEALHRMIEASGK